MADDDESLSGAEIADLARKLFGPEEDWDDAAAEFVLRLHGIDPGNEVSYGSDLILKVIERRKKQRKEIPQELLTIFAKLEAKRDKDPRIDTAQREVEKALRAGAGGGSGTAAVIKGFRHKKELSPEDEKILKELEAQLVADEKERS
jgi:hypothetical protein